MREIPKEYFIWRGKVNDLKSAFIGAIKPGTDYSVIILALAELMQTFAVDVFRSDIEDEVEKVRK